MRQGSTEIAARLWRLWMIPRDLDGGRAFLAPVLEGEPSRERALALYGEGLFALRQGAREESRRQNEAALAMAGDDAEALVLANLGLSRVDFEDGDYEQARKRAAEARARARTLKIAMSQAPLHMYAQSLRMLGDYDEASALLEESLELNRRIGDPRMISVELHNLGHVELHRGDVEAAERHFGELARRGPGDEEMMRLNEGAIAFARGDRDRAAELIDGLDSADLPADDRFEVDRLRDALV